jgi:hypothetical protein
MTSAVGHANTANPGKTLLDAFGGAYQNAIGGVASGRNQALEGASGIYGGIAQNATNAASAIGNPWSSLSSMGGKLPQLGSLFGGGGSSGGSGATGAQIDAGIQTPPAFDAAAGGTLPPANIGAGFGSTQSSSKKTG